MAGRGIDGRSCRLESRPLMCVADLALGGMARNADSDALEGTLRGGRHRATTRPDRQSIRRDRDERRRLRQPPRQIQFRCRACRSRSADEVLHIGNRDPSGAHMFLAFLEDMEGFTRQLGGQAAFTPASRNSGADRRLRPADAPPKPGDRHGRTYGPKPSPPTTSPTSAGRHRATHRP
jgi:hypothetical protein